VSATNPADESVRFDEEVVLLYDKFAHRVRGLLVHQGLDHGIAYEFANDAFLVTRRRWSQVRNSENPISYTYKVASNLRRRHFSRAHNTSVGNEVLYPDPLDVEVTSDISTEIATRLDMQAALLRLPRREREVIYLRYLCDMKISEIAYITGLSLGTVKGYIHTALAKLRKRLTDEGDLL
jgi:RNA polymerase sigma factor (sigma-70 family)